MKQPKRYIYIDNQKYEVRLLDTHELPLELPDVVDYEPSKDGSSPLSKTDWITIADGQGNMVGRREADTMPNWAGSSWYYLRYIDPKNSQVFADKEKLAYWLPVDYYFGGSEHTTLHLLYSRFWHKFLYDQGYVPTSEPYAKRINGGILLAPDGQKMSKSKGNVINPDEKLEQYGADALRLYINFIGPYDATVSWQEGGLKACKKLVDSIWDLQYNVENIGLPVSQTSDKNVVIIPGRSLHADDSFYSYVKTELEKHGISVTILSIPHASEIDSSNWINTLTENSHLFTPNTTVIAHSMGALALSRFLSDSNIELNTMILVGGVFDWLLRPFQPDNITDLAKTFLVSPINYAKINKHVKHITLIHSEDDDRVVFQNALRYKEVYPNAQLIEYQDKKHFLETSEFPELVKLITDTMEFSFTEKKVVSHEPNPKLVNAYHKLIRDVSAQVNDLKTNVAVAQIMSFVNLLKEQEHIPSYIWFGFLQVIAPFAPHITEELWYTGKGFDKQDYTKSIHLSAWPVFDPALCIEEEVTVVIQINGKVRGELIVAKDLEEDVLIEKALELVDKWLVDKKIVFKKVIPNKLVTIAVK